jgi:hypothetical protein
MPTVFLWFLPVLAGSAWASPELARTRLSEAKELYRTGQFFKAARYAFNAGEEDSAIKSEAQAFVAQALVQAGLEQAASYFYLQVIRSGNREASRRVLLLTDRIVRSVGIEFLRPYLFKHTRAEDYSESDRPYFQYAAARSLGLRGDFQGGLSLLSELTPAKKSDVRLTAELLHLRAAYRLFTGAARPAARDFLECAEVAKDSSDLKYRCIAGQARALYEAGDFSEAELVYEKVSRQSLVWTEVLFEQAWNSYRKQEYNRTLGRLVSYKSPALSFVYNPEIDTLRAQAYLALCLYEDANEGVNEFNARYVPVSEEVKKLIGRNEIKKGSDRALDLTGYYQEGKSAAQAPLSSSRPLYRLMNRFVRSAAFQDSLRSERELSVELGNIRSFSVGVSNADPQTGTFGDFLAKVLNFRLKAIREMGGAFVRNSLLDYHDQLIAQFEKMAFIKLEMLSRFKEKLMTRNSPDSQQLRSRGNVQPIRRGDQYFWSFNGEFWNDELGDYVFGLESECDGK